MQHFQQAVIGGEYEFELGHLAQLAIEFLNGVGGVNQLPHFLGIFEIGAEASPVVPPGLGNLWVFLVPALGADVQGVQSGLLIHSDIKLPLSRS